MDLGDPQPAAESGEDMQSRGRIVLERQPFSALLGTRLAHFEPGIATLELDISPQLKQQRGVVHGGVLAYLADNALTFAGGSRLGEAVATLESKINYLRPAHAGTLIARATVVHCGKRTAVATCEITAVVDHMTIRVAAAQGTIVRID